MTTKERVLELIKNEGGKSLSGENIAKALRIEVSQVNVKATTEEGLGFTGSGEGISSQAIALLQTVENYSYVVSTDEEKCAYGRC